ncbi:CLUMA_CG007503, isoform A [Clunio marinus]|uniref:CLUMA_CG007503, isoform A n=1 Tax=Clunio marinus TaxID=568069 RepID=A0A1J1I6E7_9DIPT|nr:CLUMA_CG007503, isoform A [Clunio marinus]
MDFPYEKLENFLNRIHKAVNNARRNGFRYKKQSRYEDIREIFEYYDLKPYFYGSRVMGIAKHDSDLDIYMNAGNVELNQTEAFKKVKKLAALLAKQDDWQVVIPLYARVPVLRCIYLPKHLK